MSASTTNNKQPANVQIITSSEEKEKLASRLTKLSSNSEMKSYKDEQWQYLLDAGKVTPLEVPKQDNPDELLGSVLRVEYGPHAAYGMMLVSPDARGQGLARLLLEAAMNLPADTSMKILGTCTEMGRPFYEKVGYKRVSTVTRMTVELDKLQFNEAFLVSRPPIDDLDINISDSASSETLNKLLELDAKATGLDRSETLQAIQGYPYVSTATITTKNSKDLKIATMVTQHTDSSSIMIGPILGDEKFVPTLLQAIRDHYYSSSLATKEMAVIVSDHESIVKTIADAGFETVFELGAMTMDGVPMPGQRDLYLGLIHPTLG